MAVLAALFASVMVVGSVQPAQAATFTCGKEKVARVSILYRTCWLDDGSGVWKLRFQVQNNHGSPVDIEITSGYEYGRTTVWRPPVKLRIDTRPGWHGIAALGFDRNCQTGPAGDGELRGVLQVTQNDEHPGPTAFSPVRYC